MSKVRKIILILVAVVVAVVLAVLVGRNIIIKASVSPAVRRLTGFEASVGDVDVGLFSSKIAIKNLKVTNPGDFGEKRMLDAPEIYVEYKLPSMMSSQREFPMIRLNIAEVVVVTNDKGQSNVKRIMDAKPKSEGAGTANHFDTLELTLGKVVYVDYSRMHDGKPWTKELTLNFHKAYHNLLDSDLTKIVMMETLNALPGKLNDITPDSLKKGLEGVTGIGLGAATNYTGQAVEVVKGLGGLFHSKTNAPAKPK